MDLQDARKLIDQTDKEMAALFCQRMEAVRAVAAFKAAHGIPVLDAAREKAVVEKNAALVDDPVLRAHYVNFIQSVMEISRLFQRSQMEGVRVAYSGVLGAFAEIAAGRIFPDALLLPFPDFAAAYNAVVSGSCDCCVLPIENSFAGEVGPVVDLMFNGSLYINGVYALPVRQQLLGVPGAKISDIKKVISHPQALNQCADYIKAHGFASESVSNTAVAAKTVAAAADKTLAAIASNDTSDLYGLEVLDHDLQTSAANTTRFAVFSRAEAAGNGANNRFIMLFTVNNVVGALAKVVNIICAHGFNMRVLRSRPVKDVPWQYYFYVEAEGDPRDDEGRRMLKELSVCCDRLKIVGQYAEGPTLDEEVQL